MTAERGDRADDGAEVAGIGDVVQGHQQGGGAVASRLGQQVVGVGVGVRRHLQRDALMESVGGDPIQIVTRHFEYRNPRIGCDPYGLG